MVGSEIAHYRIERLLGRGGMGAVYQARDLALNRTVALKLLADEVDQSLRTRLIHESKVSARLQHPSIATFYDAGERNGRAYIAMEYVEGATLREFLRGGAQSAEASVAIAVHLLEALVHGHAAGVIHRDIKPENIIRKNKGAIKLLDFGLAKRIASGPDAQGTTLTGLTIAGSVMGTVGYMPPEQLRGEQVDVRADLFAVGAVLYECLAGARAFPGGNLAEIISNTISRDPDPLPATTPAALCNIVARALERDRDNRYPTASQFLADLNKATDGRSIVHTARSLVVVDFENVSQAATQDWIGSGFAEALAVDLSRVEGLTVVDRQRVVGAFRSLGGSECLPAPIEIGRSLASRWVVSGAFQVLGDQIRVTARLIEVSTGDELSACKCDGNLQDLFRLQDSVAETIRKALGMQRVSDKRTPDPTLSAFEAYSRGRRFWNRLEKGSFHRAEELFSEAVESDPEYAPAWSGLAAVHGQLFTFTTDPGELDTAAVHARRAIALDPRYADPRVHLAYVLMRQGRIDEALSQLDAVLELDPENHYGHYFRGVILLGRGRKLQALQSLQRAAEVRRGAASLGWSVLGWVHVELGNEAEALWCLEQAEALPPVEDVFGATLLGEALRRFNQPQRARQQLDRGLRLLDESDHMYRDTVRAICLCSLGRTSLMIGDTSTASAAFEQAVSHLDGRNRALGAGHAMVQALAGSFRASGAPDALDRAKTLFECREQFDFSYLPTLSDDVSLLELARALSVAGERELAAQMLERSRAAGSAEASGIDALG